MKNICVVGLGYIGLPTAVLLANKGFNIHGVDINNHVVNSLNNGIVHIREPGLQNLLTKALKKKKFEVSKKPKIADVFIIAVPTPFYSSKKNKNHTPSPNTEFVFNAIKSISPFLKDGDLILIESTSPIGTTEKVASFLKSLKVNFDNLYLAYAPERVLPGNTINELVSNDRVVGGINSKSSDKAKEFYSYFVQGNIYKTNSRTSEMLKLAENSFRDVNIAFANELSILCDIFKIDVNELIVLANKHPRVNILQPGCGVGGHCIAVDPWFLVDQSNGKAKLIETSRNVNNFKPTWVIKKINLFVKNYIKEYKKIPKIALMGITFKPNIDDVRESAALKIATKLQAIYSDLVIVEPNISYLKSFNIVKTKDISNTDIRIFLVKHKEFLKMKITENDLDFCGIG